MIISPTHPPTYPLSLQQQSDGTMRTKTGELLMRRKQEAAHPLSPQAPSNQPPPSQPSPFLGLSSIHPRPKHTHISHVNDFTYVSQTTRQPPKPQPNSQSLRQLQLQNLRLIESNMRVMEWAQNLVSSLRQSILRAIDTIEEFRYLEAVNKLHQTLAQMTDYQEAVALTPLPQRHAPSTTTTPNNQLCPQIYCVVLHPHRSESDEQQQRPFPQAHTREQHFSRSISPDYPPCMRESCQSQVQGESQVWEMLVMQGVIIEQYLHLLQQQSN